MMTPEIPLEMPPKIPRLRIVAISRSQLEHCLPQASASYGTRNCLQDNRALQEVVTSQCLRAIALSITMGTLWARHGFGARIALDSGKRIDSASRYITVWFSEEAREAWTPPKPMCADTGLPRYFVKFGNEARIEGGGVALEAALRRATARATDDIPLRPNRVHPLSRLDHGTIFGLFPATPESREKYEEWVAAGRPRD